MNVKLMLIEKERLAYIGGDTALAKFFDAALQHIVGLEEEINTRDRTIAEKDEEISGLLTDLAAEFGGG